MLWTDADFISAADLTSLDNEVLLVSDSDSVPFTGENSVIRRGVEEAGDALLKHMREFGGGYCGNGNVSANHYAAVMNTGLLQGVRSRVLLNQVVVSGDTVNRWSPVKRWVAYWVLMLFYRDAANRTQNDRYSEKEKLYRKQVHGMYWEALRSAGLPTVYSPIPCPGALYEPDSGIWGPGNVSAVVGSGNIDASFEVVVTYLDSSRSTNSESHPSARLTVDLDVGKVLRVDISSLTPPTGVQPQQTRAKARVPYGRATHWNVYAGVSGGPLCLQNETPVPIAAKQYTLSGDPVTNTKQAGLGQWPEQYLEFETWVLRG